jgi:hypothetical protein
LTDSVEYVGLLNVAYGRLGLVGEARACGNSGRLCDGGAAALEVESEECGGAEPEEPGVHQLCSLMRGRILTLEGR